ncbi:leader peptidase (prepilin peptidase) / N-methyltransferase [Agromyces sp. CF514]|uniref:prepilin peptidase n=1 Tax=Agromyces sp. CF514 TaxID=1881031 RepID=UPI0008E44253|nr:A24 family peptidase [Agromyces sp. CF514]SFR69117.1 leader peptidase (prepilin peptidase) / N-methyltransferase [Agromyces sp. CF514]
MIIAEPLAVAVAALVGAVLGWWPLARWSAHVLVTERGRSVRRSTLRIACAAVAAAGFGLLTWRFWQTAELPALLAFAAASAVLGVVDVIERRLPNVVIGWFGAVTAGLLLLAAVLGGNWQGPLQALAGGTGMFAVYFVLALISPSSMGMGDVKLAAPLGMLLGWFGLQTWLYGLLGAFVIGGVLALIGLATRRVTLRGSIPFGPSMLAGALVALLIAG